MYSLQSVVKLIDCNTVLVEVAIFPFILRTSNTGVTDADVFLAQKRTCLVPAPRLLVSGEIKIRSPL